MPRLRLLGAGTAVPDHRIVFADFRRTVRRLIVERHAAREPRIVQFPRIGAR
jgi:hypothetical protein